MVDNAIDDNMFFQTSKEEDAPSLNRHSELVSKFLYTYFSPDQA